jgi:hypothetical protein
MDQTSTSAFYHFGGSDCDGSVRSLAAFWRQVSRGFEIGSAHDELGLDPLTSDDKHADRLPTRPGIQGRQEPPACRLRREG